MTALMPKGWEEALLKADKAPVTPTNVEFEDDWFFAEHNSSSYPETGGYDEGGLYNPFDTTLPEPGEAGIYNSIGVRDYASADQGIAATVSTLEEPGYGQLNSAIRGGSASVGQLEALEEETNWGTHDYPSGNVGAPKAGGGGVSVTGVLKDIGTGVVDSTGIGVVSGLAGDATSSVESSALKVALYAVAGVAGAGLIGGAIWMAAKPEIDQAAGTAAKAAATA